MKKLLLISVLTLIAGCSSHPNQKSITATTPIIVPAETKAANYRDWPILQTYDQNHLARIALPLGGIGTGTVSLGGRGDLRDWEIMNRPAKGFIPVSDQTGPFFALYTKTADGKTVARALEGPLEGRAGRVRYSAQGLRVPRRATGP